MLKKYLPLLLLCAAPAFAKPVLTVYTYDSFAADWGPGPAVKKAFEADCNCELKLVALEDGVSLLNRLRMEGKNSKADVVLGWTTICWKRPRKLNSLPKAAWRMRRSRCPAAGKTTHLCRSITAISPLSTIKAS